MNRILCFVILMVICVCVYGVDFDGGDGTSNSPWQISTEEQLLKVNEDVAACYTLISDVYIYSSYSDALISVNDSGTDSFSGTFDGNGYAILDLTITGTDDYVGLLGRVHSNGVIENLTLENVTISGDLCVGSLAGRSDGTIENCHTVNADPSVASISGAIYVGGLIGLTVGTISDCTAAVGVSATNYHVGGLIGQNNAYV